MVTDTIDFSTAGIGVSAFANTGDYVGTSLGIDLATNTAVSLTANNINTGSIVCSTGGKAASFVATNALTVDYNEDDFLRRRVRRHLCGGLNI